MHHGVRGWRGEDVRELRGHQRSRRFGAAINCNRNHVLHCDEMAVKNAPAVSRAVGGGSRSRSGDRVSEKREDGGCATQRKSAACRREKRGSARARTARVRTTACDERFLAARSVLRGTSTDLHPTARRRRLLLRRCRSAASRCPRRSPLRCSASPSKMLGGDRQRC